MKVLFGMALRQTTGFMESLLRLIGLDWDVPDFSTLSRRQKTLAVNIPHPGSQGPLHLLIDGTGIKVEGEGAWTEEGQQTVRGTVCPTMAQAWRTQAPRPAQDPHRGDR
jgi:IS5 family transposase